MKTLLCIFLFAFNLLGAEQIQCEAKPSIEIKIYRGKEEKHLVPMINAWVISHYMSFPFLYANQGETLANHVFFEDPNGFALFAEKGDQKVGMMLAIPLNSPVLDVQYSPFPMLSQMKEKGFDPDKILYGAVFVIAEEERQNQELIARMYQEAVSLAKKMGKTHICYFTTIREDHHPLKPTPYIPPEPWEELTPSPRSMDITIDLTWPTLQVDGSVKECINPQALYILDI